MDTAQPPSPTPSSSSDSSASSPRSSRAHTAASSSRRLPWTAPELSALIQGVQQYGKDYARIMRDERLGRLLRRRTVVACRKQYMFGRAMGQWRRGVRELPGLQRSSEEKQQAEGSAGESEEEKEGGAARDEQKELSSRDDERDTEHVVHATRARLRSFNEAKDELTTVATPASDDSQDDTSHMSDDSDASAARTRRQPWDNVRADELPPGKRRCEYRRCRHTCGCKGRTSEDGRAVVNKHGRRNHEKSESQHVHCDRRYGCFRLFGNLKQSGDAEMRSAEEEGEGEDESDEDESEWNAEEDEEVEEDCKQTEEAVGSRSVLGPAFPLPAAPPLYRPSSVLAHSGGTTSTSSLYPSLYSSSAAPAGARMSVVQSLLGLGPSASQQRQVSAARATEWLRFKDEADKYEDVIRVLRAQLAAADGSEEEWRRREEGWRTERAELKAHIRKLEAQASPQQKRGGVDRKRSRRNSCGGGDRGGVEIAFAASVAPQSPMYLPTYPAVSMASPSTFSPHLSGAASRLYHSPQSAFAAVGRGPPPATAPQLLPAQPLGPYWPSAAAAPLPSSQLFPQAPYPLQMPGAWMPPARYPQPSTPFFGSSQQQQQPAMLGAAGQGFPSPMSTLGLAAQSNHSIAQPIAVPLLPAYRPFTALTIAESTSMAMPAITLSPAAAASEMRTSIGQAEMSVNGLAANGAGGHSAAAANPACPF